MKLSLIAAMAHNRVIGYKNQLPWHLPADLQHFKAITLGKPIIMGRKTFEAIGKPLPNRTNIVLTTNPDWAAEGVVVVGSWEQALKACGSAEEVMVIGGEQLYRQALPLAANIYITLIEAEIQGDAYFPDWSASEWHEVERLARAADEKNVYNMEFVVFSRDLPRNN